MFSPDAAVPASLATRNPRRRQRTSSEDSVAVRHNPKRVRRSVLNPETFKDPAVVKVNGHLDHDEEVPYTNGHAKEPGNQRLESADTTSLVIRHRGVKKSDREKRTSKNDGTVELASDHAVKFGICNRLTSCDIRLRTRTTSLHNCQQRRNRSKTTTHQVRAITVL